MEAHSMTTEVDIVNRALQAIGTRTTVTSAELANSTTNEAIQANLIIDQVRDDLLRMAPWNCSTYCDLLTYITSVPGTPENQSAATTNWERGQPFPPWMYEYQYPVDCLKPLWIIPQYNNSFGVSPPITTAVTGNPGFASSYPPILYKVATDLFYPVNAATVVSSGAGHAVGDIITLIDGAVTDPPIGAPCKLRVATLAGSAVATVTIVNQVAGSSPALGGSYFAQQTNPVIQGTTTGVGNGSSYNLTYDAAAQQRVILTNQSNAALSYVKQVTDPNIMDTLFQSAWINILAANLAMVLTGDKAIANMKIATANQAIAEARKADGNEGLTVNDVTPDWIRVRGVNYSTEVLGPTAGFDWGPFWATW